ncbi:MAG TPA: pyrroline-5-carboxylate reductase [Negativicutes bacterium]|nr:pyrroline-5-carboxylate reductase [Negativicutes bacterium]
MLSNKKIGFVGGGAMCEALMGGLLSRGMLKPTQVTVHDVVKERLHYLKERYAVHIAESGQAVASTSDVLFLTVKPQVMASVLSSIGKFVPKKTLVVSIAAGIKIATIEKYLLGVPVVRVMPNTPVAVGEGMSAVARGTNADEAAANMVSEMFSAVGRSVQVDESMMDAVTGLSGSGPAFFFLMLDALSDAGVRVGFSRQNALLLSAQTMLGAAKMVLETGEHPGKLKDMVTSPGGTAISGVHMLETHSIRAALIEAVVAATARSRDMGKDQ